MEEPMQTESTVVENNNNAPSSNEGSLKFVINFKKQNFDIACEPTETLGAVRQKIALQTGVAPGLQKLMFKGMLKDDNKTMQELGIKDGTKIMLIGSTLNEIMSAAAAPPPQTGETSKVEDDTPQESLSEQLPHKKIIDKGIPEGAEPGKKGRHEQLPSTPLQNIYNNIGVKVRLTFKMWSQELWIQSSSSTQKIPFNSVRAVQYEPIKGHEEYHIVSLQLGASDKHKYYLYWVPCQYVKAIKTALTGDYLGGY
eukprot:CAMPEP_0168558700 /NCGR_PEP_ID=MMETSP0413-20121227/10115_1 /TAXON_ID=136452 /ORGANISM="Filamoeba nolandi, Strain NC-AS-23-1" /LENGTH=253 /DNA_ID=CAMNT_0008589849 /DNA_START=19 /DNA_END=780 /DNA_ORIENTATION=+